MPPTAADTAGLVCQLTLCHAQAAVLDKQPGEVAAPVDAATELAERFGATGDDSLGCDHSPAEVGLRRMWLAFEAGEPDQVVSIARDVHPERHPFLTGRADYWMHYGQALAQLPGASCGCRGGVGASWLREWCCPGDCWDAVGYGATETGVFESYLGVAGVAGGSVVCCRGGVRGDPGRGYAGGYGVFHR